MKHVTYGEKMHFVGDETADVLLEYARVLGASGGTDTVTLTAVEDHGNVVEATFLLNPSTVLLSESSTSPMEEPDNDAVVMDLRDRIAAITHPPQVQPEEHLQPVSDDWP